MNRLKHISYVCVSAVLLLLLAFASNIKTETRKMQTVLKTVSEEEYADLPKANCHSFLSDNGNITYTTDANYPIVSLPPHLEPINCIEIEFKEPIKENTSVGLYYREANENFSESKALHHLITENETKVLLHIPEGIYADYMLSIIGDYSIECVTYGIAELKGVSDDFSHVDSYYDINWPAIFLLLCLGLFLVLTEKSYGYISAITELFKKIWGKMSRLNFAQWAKTKLYRQEDYMEHDDKGARRTANVFTVLALVFGTLTIYLTPPMAVPDEIAHFANVCNISSGNIFKGKSANGNRGYYLFSEEIDFMYYFDSKFGISFGGDDYSFSQAAAFANKYAYGTDKIVFHPHYGAGINPASYLPSVIVIAVFKMFLNITNVLDLYILAKISSLIFVTITIRIAILKTPILRNTLFLLALMPMTIFQLCSVSYDVGTVCGAFLLFAYSTRLILAGEAYQITGKDIFAVCFAMSCLFACKLLYVVLALVLFAISSKKFGGAKKYVACISCVIAMGLIFYLVPTVLNNDAISAETMSISNDTNGDILLKNGKLIPTIIVDTFLQNKNFYIQTFVGNLGWYHAPLPNVFIKVYILILCSVAIVEISSVRGFNVYARLLSSASSLLVICGIILSMYLGCAGFGSNTAGGVQGRYFIPVSIYLPLLFANPMLCKFKYTEKIQDCIGHISKGVATAYLVLTCAVLFTTYWL